MRKELITILPYQRGYFMTNVQLGYGFYNYTEM